jgi:hypothetical protein
MGGVAGDGAGEAGSPAAAGRRRQRRRRSSVVSESPLCTQKEEAKAKAADDDGRWPGRASRPNTPGTAGFVELVGKGSLRGRFM